MKYLVHKMLPIRKYEKSHARLGGLLVGMALGMTK